MEYQVLAAKARDEFNLYRQRMRLIESENFKRWWKALPRKEQEELAAVSLFQLRRAFRNHDGTPTEHLPIRILREKASLMGVKYYSNMKRAELVKALQEVSCD